MYFKHSSILYRRRTWETPTTPVMCAEAYSLSLTTFAGMGRIVGALAFCIRFPGMSGAQVVNEEGYRMHLGTSFMMEYETTTLGETYFHGRSSSYLSMSVRMGALALINNVHYYQPRLFDASDHRLALEAGLLIN